MSELRNTENTTVVSHHHTREQATLRAYVAGFIGSIVLTLAAYLLVVNHALSRSPLVAIIIILALTQFFVQLVCFMQFGRGELRPRLKLLVFIGMSVAVLILVLGSLWIMNNLNHRMTPRQILQYMNNQQGF